MIELNSYADAVRAMRTARNKSEGKPLHTYGYRMFQEGDEYVVKFGSKNHGWRPIARILPNDTLVLEFLTTAHIVELSIVYNTYKILPILVTNVGKKKYRVHIRPLGMPANNAAASYAYDNWSDFKKRGYILHNGMIIHLPTRTVVYHKPPEVVVDAGARKVWLREVGALKRYLKTVAKLGGFTALIADLEASGVERWRVTRPFFIYGDCNDLTLVTSALKGGSHQEFVARLAELMYSGHERSVGDHIKFIDRFFNNNSHIIRTHIGVISYK